MIEFDSFSPSFLLISLLLLIESKISLPLFLSTFLPQTSHLNHIKTRRIRMKERNVEIIISMKEEMLSSEREKEETEEREKKERREKFDTDSVPDAAESKNEIFPSLTCLLLLILP